MHCEQNNKAKDTNFTHAWQNWFDEYNEDFAVWFKYLMCTFNELHVLRNILLSMWTCWRARFYVCVRVGVCICLKGVINFHNINMRNGRKTKLYHSNVLFQWEKYVVLLKHTYTQRGREKGREKVEKSLVRAIRINFFDWMNKNGKNR